MIKKTLLVLVILGSFNSCVVVKEYEKVYLNDTDMVLADKKINKFGFHVFLRSMVIIFNLLLKTITIIPCGHLEPKIIA